MLLLVATVGLLYCLNVFLDSFYHIVDKKVYNTKYNQDFYRASFTRAGSKNKRKMYFLSVFRSS